MGQETVDSDLGDERRRVPVTTEKPYTGIAHLKHGNGKAIGTGFLVKHGGGTFLVTAAHCLWDRGKGAFKAKIHISLGRDGECHPFGTIKKKSVDFEVPREYKETHGRKYDYGIICLDKEKHMLDKCCAFDLEPRTDEYIENQDLYMSGYPGIPEERRDGVPGWPPGTQWKIKLTTVTVNKRRLQYRDATTPGNSGSPVYQLRNGRYVAHGIHTNGIDKKNTSNEAVWIDVDALMKLVKMAYTHPKKQQGCPQNRSGADMTKRNGNLVPNNPRPTSVATNTVQTRPQDPPPQPNGNAPGHRSWLSVLWHFLNQCGGR
ncbi:glutamyl endopeptidase-like [Haliotis rufescens]|uniref:glutamyl endopeptidase-like n=1 Tax=Haliotis rufescens TaxID=6454 RepID=UPI00201F13B9|nr:glutamyl endopeptidase-like [Haliotis rufescens]XP_048251703.1 glutamyl endopeptidase-like [Haliotis rufescens]